MTGYQNSMYVYTAFRRTIEELLSHIQYPLLLVRWNMDILGICVQPEVIQPHWCQCLN